MPWGGLAPGGHFRAIVCDWHMPGMSGIEFHDEVAKLDAGLARRFVYVTGAEPSFEFADFLKRTKCACLGKPFGSQVLRDAVAAVASAPSSGPEAEAPSRPGSTSPSCVP